MTSKIKDKLYYLAHPYSNDPLKNIENCVRIANELLNQGYNIYAPILMTHPLHVHTERTWDKWMELDKVFMDRCDGLILSGNWCESKGCVVEKEYFLQQKKQILEFRMNRESQWVLHATDNRLGSFT